VILLFPNLETLRGALISEAIPANVCRAPLAAGFDVQSQVWIQPAAPLSRDTQAKLRRLGVHLRKDSPVRLDQSFSCWPQLLPLEPAPKTWAETAQDPVLFELADTAALPELVAEILRQGNDRQSYRWLREDGPARALLRVAGPPYYSLLRTLDRAGPGPAPRAYRELCPHVWVEVGYTHPAAGWIRPPPGQFVLVRAPGHWTFLDEGEFHAVHKVRDFPLPPRPVSGRDAEFPHKLSVSLRLARSRSIEAAELWVLDGNGPERLRALVDNADDTLVSRLAFAMGERDGHTRIALWARPSRLPPPVLVLDGIGFRPYLRLAHLFLPCGFRLHPPLRRDIVTQLLAADSGQITWLYPRADGRFTVESLPEEAFRPLHHVVVYVLDQEPRGLPAWEKTGGFEFEPFAGQEEPAARNLSPRPARAARESKARPAAEPKDGGKRPKKPARRAAPRPHRRKDEVPEEVPLPRKAGALEQRLRTLEQQFLGLTSPPDSPERQQLWQAMAPLNAALGQNSDSALCWLNAFWEADPPEPAALTAWLQAEVKTGEPERWGPECNRLLGLATPEARDLRALAVLLVGAAHAARPVPHMMPLLARLPPFLERHESLLPVRGVWLAWVALCRLARHDVLALARARDRLLERLYLRGLSVEQDLPGFLRFTGLRAGSRFRQIREHVPNLRRLAQRWLREDTSSTARTPAYADLIFAFALARLGETTECHKLLHRARQELSRRDEGHGWLSAAYEFRTQQALEGKPAAGPLPEALRGQLDVLAGLGRYKVDRLREGSRILEPHENLDPLRKWIAQFADALSRELAALRDLDDRAALADRLTRLLARPRKGDGQAAGVRTLTAALELAPRLGEAFAADLLGRLALALEQTPGVLEQALLLEKGLFLAAHFDRAEQVQALVARFHQLLQTAHGADTLQALEASLGQCLGGLRRLGMRDEIGRLMERMAALVVGNEDLLKPKKTGPAAPGSQSRAWQLLLHLAAGWFALGNDDRAWPLLDQVRALLRKGTLPPMDQTTLICAYADTLAHAPIDLALPRLVEVFQRLKPVHYPFTTDSHFSLPRLEVVEAVVLALVSDDMLLNQEARRWLEDDEFFVRRRIHRDVRAALGQAGLG
jgi:hypothetical protein